MSEKYNKRVVFKKTGGGYERKTYGGMSIKDFKIPILAPFPTIDMMSGARSEDYDYPKFGKGLPSLTSSVPSLTSSVPSLMSSPSLMSLPSAKPSDIFDEINKRLGAMKIKTKKGGSVLEF